MSMYLVSVYDYMVSSIIALVCSISEWWKWWWKWWCK